MSLILAAAAITCLKPAQPVHHKHKPVPAVATCEATRPVVFPVPEEPIEPIQITLPPYMIVIEGPVLPCVQVQHWWSSWFDWDNESWVGGGRPVTARIGLPGRVGAPEIDPNSALAGLTLLAGMCAILRGRNK